MLDILGVPVSIDDSIHPEVGAEIEWSDGSRRCYDELPATVVRYFLMYPTTEPKPVRYWMRTDVYNAIKERGHLGA